MADKKKIKLTSADVKARQEQKNQLLFVDREECLKALAEAKSHGDLSENAEYSDAKARLAEIDNKLAEIEEELNNYELEESNNNIYDITLTNKAVGAKREIKGLKIGGSVSFDLDDNQIPLDSPLAVALKNAIEGDEKSYKVGEVVFTVKVNKITPINN